MACRSRKRYLSRRRRADDKSLDTHDSMKTTWKTTARHKSYAVTANTQRCRETPDRNSETAPLDHTPSIPRDTHSADHRYRVPCLPLVDGSGRLAAIQNSRAGLTNILEPRDQMRRPCVAQMRRTCYPTLTPHQARAALADD